MRSGSGEGEETHACGAIARRPRGRVEMDCAVTDRWVATGRGAGRRALALAELRCLLLAGGDSLTGEACAALSSSYRLQPTETRRHTVGNIGVSAACAVVLGDSCGPAGRHQSHDYLLVDTTSLACTTPSINQINISRSSKSNFLDLIN